MQSVNADYSDHLLPDDFDPLNEPAPAPAQPVSPKKQDKSGDKRAPALRRRGETMPEVVRKRDRAVVRGLRGGATDDSVATDSGRSQRGVLQTAQNDAESQLCSRVTVLTV